MSYNADSIKILNSLDHIKLRKGMYIGEGTDPRQLISEIIDNAIDEVQAGFSSKLVVSIDTKKNEYAVRDFGRGIPHGLKTLPNGDKKEVIEVLMTESNSGGKFDNSSYNYSSGLNGLGMTITNALSTEMEVISYRAGKYVSGLSHSGNDFTISKGTSSEPTGTLVRFIPNGSEFHSGIIPVEFIHNKCRVASAFGFSAELFVDGNQLDTACTVYDLIEEEVEVSTYADIPMFDVSNDRNERMMITLRYTSDTKDRYFAYTNLLNNYLGGTHVNYFYSTLLEAWEEFIGTHKNLVPKVALRKSDYAVGLRGVVAVYIQKPEFSSQTKEKLVNNKAYFAELMTLFKKRFKKYLDENILLAQQLIKRFEEYRIAQNALLNRKEISSLIKISEDDPENIRKRSVVSKLVECTSSKRDERELFIVEGDSALGPYMFVRNTKTQAVLPLRGKILNVTGKSIKDSVQNKEICDIANSIGCGIGANCDANKSRYNKVIISADADPDGLQINCLVLSVFINLFPDMVKQGRVYVSIPPLYCWGDNVKNYGWTNDITRVPTNVKNLHRFKGLGEMNADQLEYFLVEPKTRNVMQIEYPSDVDQFNKILGTGEGKAELMKELGIIVS